MNATKVLLQSCTFQICNVRENRNLNVYSAWCQGLTALLCHLKVMAYVFGVSIFIPFLKCKLFVATMRTAFFIRIKVHKTKQLFSSQKNRTGTRNRPRIVRYRHHSLSNQRFYGAVYGTSWGRADRFSSGSHLRKNRDEISGPKHGVDGMFRF